jgi:hypothetical protein
VLSKLPAAADAAFNHQTNEHDPRCHPDTRVELLTDIRKWVADPHGKCIFWLVGRAGTGKSTIARTVAQICASQGLLGASFFFKRGEGDRGNAALLFTTVASQLAIEEPALAAHIAAAIDTDPAVTRKPLKEQFEKLVMEPLSKLKEGPDRAKTFVLVIDALDECAGDANVQGIARVLLQATIPTSVRLRVFVTSRPELPILREFSMNRGRYQNLALHEIPTPIIEHDIATFLDFELGRIRTDYNALASDHRQLPPDWPGSQVVYALVQMAVPLFIFAATVCRFIQEPGWDPRRQVAKVLDYQSKTNQSEIDKLDATYGPVLEQLLVGSKEAGSSLANQFCAVVGSIVLLAEPLSIRALACLLELPEDDIFSQLQSLQSVLIVPDSAEYPVRAFHLSFRDFLFILTNAKPIRSG